MIFGLIAELLPRIEVLGAKEEEVVVLPRRTNAARPPACCSSVPTESDAASRLELSGFLSRHHGTTHLCF